MNKEGFWSVSDVLNHIYCPWITFHWYVLKIPQCKTTKTEEGLRRQTEYVKKARKHPERGIGGMKGAKFVAERFLRSSRLMLAGKCDYIVYPQGQACPLEIKNGRLPYGKPYKNTIVQLVCYAIMLEEEINDCVNFAFIHYLKDNLTQKVTITEKEKLYIEEIIKQMNSVLEKEIVKGKPMSWKCCWDCCYRKICALGGGS
ncbi:MAG: CRISPR-associated protein Cas4 [Candidatus Anstonellales archaeon]